MRGMGYGEQMKGYLSFLLALASVFLILSFIEAAEQSGKISFSKAIAAERAYQAQMNAKEAVLEAVHDGAAEGFRTYNSTHSVAACADPAAGDLCFKADDARLAAKLGAYAYIAKLGEVRIDPDMDVRIWCRQGMSRDLADSFARYGNAAGSEAYQPVGQDLAGLINGTSGSAPPSWPCLDSVYPHIEYGEDASANPHLEKTELTSAVGVSVDYPAFNVSAVSYIPKGYMVEP